MVCVSFVDGALQLPNDRLVEPDWVTSELLLCLTRSMLLLPFLINRISHPASDEFLLGTCFRMRERESFQSSWIMADFVRSLQSLARHSVSSSNQMASSMTRKTKEKPVAVEGDPFSNLLQPGRPRTLISTGVNRVESWHMSADGSSTPSDIERPRSRTDSIHHHSPPA